MKNIMHHNLVNRYNRGTATHNYVFGFVRNGMVYAVQVNNAADMLMAITYPEQRSAGGWTLKYRPNKAQQELILANATRVEVLGSFEWFEAEKVNHHNNRGDCFEDIAAIRWNGKQPASRSAKFTDCGDFNANGVEFQCKFGCSKGAATFTNEATLNNLGL